MSQTIKILPQSLANKIAAGEVIQRPASAVKELIENSIDANSNSIQIIIKDGGSSLIHVIDDGRGMSKEDASIAFHRHATSKISVYEDLECITTLGFRGEALASIASVSQVEMRTRMKQLEIGTKVKIEGGSILEISDDTFPGGTSIQVRNLFYNTPARRNFLKSINTEYRHIYDVVERVALSYPELSLKFIANDDIILNLRPSPIQERISEIFGNKLTQTLIYFEEKNELIELSGFLGRPDYSRKGKAQQYLFLNKRFVVNRNLSHAVYQAYEHLLEKGNFPLFILYLSIDPRKVDVNVHPSKMEVKFENESSIYRAVLSVIRKSLSSQNLIPSVQIEDNISSTRSKASTPNIEQTDWKQLIQPDKIIGQMGSKFEDERSIKLKFESEAINQMEIETQIEKKTIWQVHNKYIIKIVSDGIMIIDQHAAHERILYEKARARFTQEGKESQQLLFPQTIQLSPGDTTIVKQLYSDLERLGFTIKFFGNSTVIVDGVPPEIKPGEESTILQEIISLFKEDEQQIRIEPKEKLAKSFACKAAIKAGDPLSDNEMKSLIEQLFNTEIPYVCPHGRPVSLKLSLTELDKRFSRT